MTAQELENALMSVNFQSMSDDDLHNLHSTLSLRLSEISWIIHGRKQFHQTLPHHDNK